MLKKKMKKTKKKKQWKHKKKGGSSKHRSQTENLLYKEEKTWAGNYITIAAYIMNKLPNKVQISMKQAYKELFSQDLTEDIAICFCEGDEFY